MKKKPGRSLSFVFFPTFFEVKGGRMKRQTCYYPQPKRKRRRKKGCDAAICAFSLVHQLPFFTCERTQTFLKPTATGKSEAPAPHTAVGEAGRQLQLRRISCKRWSAMHSGAVGFGDFFQLPLRIARSKPYVAKEHMRKRSYRGKKLCKMEGNL